VVKRDPAGGAQPGGDRPQHVAAAGGHLRSRSGPGHACAAATVGAATAGGNWACVYVCTCVRVLLGGCRRVG